MISVEWIPYLMTLWEYEFSLNLDFDQMESLQNYIKKLFILLYDLLYIIMIK
jgi:hypothetical protein